MVLHGWTMAAKNLTEFLQKVGLWFLRSERPNLNFCIAEPRLFEWFCTAWSSWACFAAFEASLGRGLFVFSSQSLSFVFRKFSVFLMNFLSRLKLRLQASRGWWFLMNFHVAAKKIACHFVPFWQVSLKICWKQLLVPHLGKQSIFNSTFLSICFHQTYQRMNLSSICIFCFHSFYFGWKSTGFRNAPSVLRFWFLATFKYVAFFSLLNFNFLK